ncbi:hypothetical protein RIF29_40191 [Crotalaria pallida]|uniref:Uncharacterized protein n=1 Tax=Crotalaria pallida TaxID=3830 RepID=A0AAN9E4C2_CROPI
MVAMETVPPSGVVEIKAGTDAGTVSSSSQTVNAEHNGNEGITEANDGIPKNEELFGAWMLAKKPLRKRLPNAKNQGVFNANHVVGKSHTSTQPSGSRFGALNGDEADSNPLLGFVVEQANTTKPNMEKPSGKAKGPSTKRSSKFSKQVTKAHDNPKAQKEASVSQKKIKNAPPVHTVPVVQLTANTEASVQDKAILAAEKKKKEEEIFRLMKTKEKEGASFLDPYMVYYYSSGEMEYLQKQKARGKHNGGEGSSKVSSLNDVVLDGSSNSSFKATIEGNI